ncbi:hypothetical protein [Streptomyces kanasensis]|uniref:hypothetical protein n=1 Tax=Streptomyces kanasensis TaxID=936756 RepID=UPI0037F1C40B
MAPPLVVGVAARTLMVPLAGWRGTVTRYDKSPVSHLAGLRLRATTIRTRGLVRAR